MNDVPELGIAKLGCGLLVGVVCAFVVSTWLSWRELRFAVSGRSVDATITSAEVVTRRMGRSSHQVLAVAYVFATVQGLVSGSLDLPVGFPVPEAGVLPLVYLPSRPEVIKVKGHGQTVPVGFFLVCCVLLVVSTITVWRQGGQDVARSKRS